MKDVLRPEPLSPGHDPQVVVNRITGAAKSSFSLGMKLLSRPRRQGMNAVYAFCRVVDDIADGDLPITDKHDLLQAWRAEIERLYKSVPVSAIGQALVKPVSDYGLPKGEFLAMIEGMEMDANGPIIAPDWDELSHYNRCVAGSVGLMSMRIFGAWIGEESHDFAMSLANALQLTNIIRDVEEDAAIGRIYLPIEVLDAAGVRPDCQTIATDPGLPDARSMIGAWAEQCFDEAKAGVRHHNRVALAPALAMYGVYHGYLTEMKRARWQPQGVASMSKGQKFRNGIAALMMRAPA